MSVNVVADRLKAQAQQLGLASDYVMAKVLYGAADEIERLVSERFSLTDRIEALEAEVERLSSRVTWFEKAGGVAMATRIHDVQAKLVDAEARIPDPDDLRLVLLAVPESRLVEVEQDEDGEMVFPATPVGHALARLRATLPTKGEDDGS